MAGACQILSRPAEFHEDGSLGNHGARIRADNVHAEHAVRDLVREHFDEAVRSAVHLGAAIGGEGESAGLVSDAVLFQLRLPIGIYCFLSRKLKSHNKTAAEVGAGELDLP